MNKYILILFFQIEFTCKEMFIFHFSSHMVTLIMFGQLETWEVKLPLKTACEQTVIKLK